MQILDPSLERLTDRGSQHQGYSALAHHGIALVVIIISWLLYSEPLLFSAGHLWAIDLIPQDVPERISAAMSVLRGEFPTWNPNLMCGYAQIDNSHAGILYPLSAIFLFMPNAKGNDVFLAVHDLMFCLFLYAYICKHTASPASATLASVCGMSSESWRICHGMSMTTPTIAYLPLALLLIDWWVEGRALVVKALIVVNALLLLTGAPNLALIVYLTEACYLLFLLAGRMSLLKIVFKSAVITVGAVLLASVQFIPLLVYFRESNRSEFVDKSAVVERFVPWNFIFAPSWYDISGMETLSDYFTFSRMAFIVILAMIGLVSPRAWRIRGFWPVIVVTSYLVAAGIGPFRFVQDIPLFSIFKWPVVYIIPGVMGVFVLVGLGFLQIVRLFQWALPTVALIPGWLMVIFLCLFFTSHDLYPQTTTFDVYRDADRDIVETLAGSDKYRLWNYSRTFVGASDLDVIKANIGSLAPNSNLVFDVPVVDQLELTDTVSPARIDAIMRLKERVPEQWPKVLRMAGVTHLSGIEPSPVPEVTLLKDDGIKFYRLDRSLGRAWLVCQAVAVPDRKSAVEKVIDPSFNPAETVVIEASRSPLLLDAARRCVGRVEYSNPLWKESRISVESEADAMLVIADSYWPFVYAWVDGDLATVYPANVAFRAVAVKAGKHEVLLRVIPVEFYLGLAVSAVTAIVLFAWPLRRTTQ